MRKILNDVGIVTLIAIIGMMLGMTLQWYYLFDEITDANQKLDMLLDEKGDTVCRVVKIDSNYYFVCDETVGNTADL